MFVKGSTTSCFSVVGESDSGQTRPFSKSCGATILIPATTSAATKVISNHSGRRWKYVLAIAGSDLVSSVAVESRIFLRARASSCVDVYRFSGFLAMHRWTMLSSAAGTFGLRDAIGFG